MTNFIRTLIVVKTTLTVARFDEFFSGFRALFVIFMQ